MNEIKYWQDEVKYYKNLARYYYVVGLIQVGMATEDDIDDDMEIAYAEFCRRDDLFSEDEVGHFHCVEE